tara:strand:- start:4229 stop:5626 length:1398 start_codon:yes stop_codon:yes gene_type:complete
MKIDKLLILISLVVVIIVGVFLALFLSNRSICTNKHSITDEIIVEYIELQPSHQDPVVVVEETPREDPIPVSPPCTNFSWVQRGMNFANATGAGGTEDTVSLSSDANTVAVGIQRSAQVQIFDWDGSDWIQRGTTIVGEVAGDHNGGSVSLSSDGNTIAIGAYRNDNVNGQGAGQVRIFDWDGSDWVQRGLSINGEVASDSNGFAVSLSSDGNTVAMSAIGSDALANNGGQTRIFDWNGNAWVQKGSSINGQSNELSGWSISLRNNGDTIAIGAPVSFNEPGFAYIFDWDGNDWVQRGLNIVGDHANDQSGYSISLSLDTNTVAIGARRNNIGGSGTGAIKIYDWDGSDWTQRGNVISGDNNGDNAGETISLSDDGNSIGIGVKGVDNLDDPNQLKYEVGLVRIYDWNNNTMLWEPRGDDIKGVDQNDRTGTAVSLSADGNTFIASTPKLGSPGYIQVFDWACSE